MSDLDTCGPECKPLTTLEQIIHWQNFVTPSVVTSLQERTEFSVSGQRFHCHCEEDNLWKHAELITDVTPRTLVCHDMRGGYIEDRFIYGTSTDNAYRFFNWAGIDLFVYFSHNLLTIPPPCWISAGHLHGVKVLGTFITEWDDGESVLSDILSNKETMNLVVENMVNICDKFSFDGYLLNVENKLESHLIPCLKMFVRDLHKLLKEKLPKAELIWYDSIINDGSLKWQNELNSNNKSFFDLCDGILLNYPWKEVNLERSAIEAGGRIRDVFAGIDVFGRGSFGGGGFGSAVAVKEARRHGLSAAFFAPGWTHEVLGGVHFTCTEHLFWARIRPFLYLRGPTRLPIVTSFCQGFGHRGRVKQGLYPNTAEIQPWYDLSRQRLQPTVSSCLDMRCSPKVEIRQVEVSKEVLDAEPRKEKGPEVKVSEEESNGQVDKVDTSCDVPADREKVREVDISRDVSTDGERVEEGDAPRDVSADGEKESPMAPEVTPAPDCRGANHGCVQHFEDDAYDGGGCLRITRMPSESEGMSLHRLVLCDLVSTSGTLNVIYATKNFPEDIAHSSALRLAFVVRVSIYSEPKIIWVDDYPGSQVKRSECGKKWISVECDDSALDDEQNSWKVYKYSVALTDHVNEVLACLPPGCNSALLGWLEIFDNEV